MSVTFTCRLLVIGTLGGRLKVQYGPLGDECVRVLQINGPAIVIPPDGELTAQEFKQWELAHCSPPYSFFVSNIPLDAPLVEARRTYEDEIPPGAVRAELCWDDVQGFGQSFCVRVTSKWNRSIPDFSLSVDYAFDAPQPVIAPGSTEASKQVQYAGGSDSFFRSLEHVPSKELRAGQTSRYMLHPRALEPARSRAASMSPERHCIALRTAGRKFDEIPGRVVAEFLSGDAG